MSYIPLSLQRTKRYLDLSLYPIEQKKHNKQLIDLVKNKLFVSLEIKYPLRTINKSNIQLLKFVKKPVMPSELPFGTQPFSLSEIEVPGVAIDFIYNGKTY